MSRKLEEIIKMNPDYYRISRGEKQAYVEVWGEKREEFSKLLRANASIFERAKMKVETITESDYRVGRTLSCMPTIGKGIESCFVE